MEGPGEDNGILDAPLVLSTGAPTTVRELAGGRDVLVYFMRTFTCPPCRGHVRQLGSAQPLLRAAELAVVVVGPGNPDEADTLRDHLHVPFPVAADRERRVFRAAGLERGIAGLQRSGAVAYDLDGRELFAHRTTLPIRAPDLDRLLATVRGRRA
ncbi:MAG: hypothetical protein V7607_1724 [Solirubrobacteraceae bacterium]